MHSFVGSSTERTLRDFAKAIKSIPSETGKREAFSSLLGQLFGSSREVTLMHRGAETGLEIINESGKWKRGSADTMFGYGVIEFERDLKKTGEHAKEQLCEYVAGMWQKRNAPSSVAAVATDGIQWQIFYPKLPPHSAITPESVVLGDPRQIDLKEGTLGDFYRWLNQFLFRPLNLEPTSEAIREDFGSHTPLYELALAGLRRAWVAVRGEPEAQLARETWQSYLTITYGKLSETDSLRRDAGSGTEISEVDDLYLRHTWLVSMSRLMVWASMSKGVTSEPLHAVAQKVFSGQYFNQHRLANLTDYDFFHWVCQPTAVRELAGVWERVLDALLTYDLSLIREDVLKGVYHELVDPKDRHDLGEYYTPDWLCERIIAELLPQTGFAKVLDPSCGSGSFLRAAIHHFLEHNESGGKEQRLQAVLENVQGIDIHPVAVTIAKATYVLALGDLVKSTSRPLQIPIYLADALFLPRDVEATLIEKLGGKDISFGPRKLRKRFTLPDVLVQHPEAFDSAIAAATAIAEEHARASRETARSLRTALVREVPWILQSGESGFILEALWAFTEGLAELIRSKQNSIWSFVIRNSFRPAMLRDQFDYIVGNPPWVAYRYVTDPDYQAEIKRLAVDTYGIAPRQQKLFKQMELATVFMAHAIATFAKRSGKLAFVMPRSVLTADQHQNIITGQHPARFKLTAYWDLWDVKPLFNVPCCVLFADFSLRPGGDKPRTLPILTWQGTLKSKDARWVVAKDKLTAKSGKGRVVRLGSRAALSAGAGSIEHSKSSPYAKAFKQGATLVPRNMWFVESNDTLDHMRDGVTYVKTSEMVARDSKPPYQEVRLEGLIENCFLYSTTLAANILPFALREPLPVVLPVEEVNGEYLMRDVEYLRENGYRKMMAWLRKAETIWVKKRGAKADRYSLLNYLNYQGKLTAQNPGQQHLVLYNATGTNISATYFDQQARQQLPLLVDHKCY